MCLGMCMDMCAVRRDGSGGSGPNTIYLTPPRAAAWPKVASMSHAAMEAEMAGRCRKLKCRRERGRLTIAGRIGRGGASAMPRRSQREHLLFRAIWP